MMTYTVLLVAYLSTQCLEWVNVPWPTPIQARWPSVINWSHCLAKFLSVDSS